MRSSRFLFALASVSLGLLASCIPGIDGVVTSHESRDYGPLVLSEIQARNSATKADESGDYPDWIEIENVSNDAVQLSAFSLTCSSAPSLSWKLPERELEGGGLLIIWADSLNLAPSAGELHANFTLDGSGGTITLKDSSGAEVDKVNYPEQARDHSFIRTGKSTWKQTDLPTPGAGNDSAIPMPNFSRGAGFYDAELSLALSGGTVIRYTLDGSPPDESSTLYSGPITLNPGDFPPPVDGLPPAAVVTAAVFRDGVRGKVATNTYFFSLATKLAVVSLSAAPADIFDSSTGFYTNYGDDMEKKVHIEYFDTDHHLALEQDAGASPYGAYSRGFAQKSIALRARRNYGKARFEYPFFSGRDGNHPTADSFEGLVLRNSGNDWNSTFIRDAFMTSLLEDTTVDYQAYRPVVLYINGQYWGLYSMREKVGEDFIRNNHSEYANADFDIIANYSDIMEGDRNDLDDLIAYVNNNDLSVSANYSAVTKRIDLDNFIDYHIANVFFGNTDWPNNNNKFWRPKVSGGKWHWIATDTDFGFGGIGDPVNGDTLSYLLERDDNASLFIRSLMENPTFRTRFFNRFEKLAANDFLAKRVIARIDAYANEVADEASGKSDSAYSENSSDATAGRHILRWRDSSSDWDWFKTGQTWRYNVQVMRDFASGRGAAMKKAIADAKEAYTDTDTPMATGSGDGLTGEYFNNTDLTGDPVLTRTDAEINFYWDTDPADTTVLREYFSARWKGYLMAPWSGTGKLILAADDGIRMWVGNAGASSVEKTDANLVIDAWVGQGVTAYTAEVTMTAGSVYPIIIEYYQGNGGAAIYLYWRHLMDREIIPQSQLYTTKPSA